MASSFLSALDEQRPTYKIDLEFSLEDGKPAQVECTDLSPRDWWVMPEGRGVPVIDGVPRPVSEWSPDQKEKYWTFLRWVCRRAVRRIREVEKNGEGYIEKWVPVEWHDEGESRYEGGVLHLTVEAFDAGTNVASVGQQVIFRRELRRRDTGGDSDEEQPGSVRKTRKAKRAAATRDTAGAT